MPKAFIRIWLAVLIIIACVIRVKNADTFYYNTDEAMHTTIASGSGLLEVLRFAHYEIHPPLLYILCHYWLMVSDNPAFVRGLSLVFGLLLIAVYYFIGKTLNGEMTGMVCATLITFGNGCIIQSYVVRQYGVFLLFISLAFYCYLKWHNTRPAMALIGYVICGWLAALSHFSAIFCIAAIAIFEAAHLWLHRFPWQRQIQWVLANIAIALVAVYVYRLWQPIITTLKPYFIYCSVPMPKRIFNALSYPAVVAQYIYPSHASAVLILLGLAAFSFRENTVTCGKISPRALVALAAIAFALGMALFLTDIYSPLGTRRSLWILPLLVPPAGWMLSSFGERMLQLMLPQSRQYQSQIAAIFFLTAGCLLYSQQERFSDGTEYVWQQEQWDAFKPYMEKLGPRDLIVTEKDDGIMLANLYRYMGDDAFTGKVMATLAPWRNTHILFNPYYTRNFSTDIFLITLTEARNKHWFDGIDRIVFLRMAWSRSPLTDLMLCPALEKQIITFPDFLSQSPLTRDNITRARAALMLVSKETFLRDVLSPGGKARACMDGKHDLTPGLTTPITKANTSSP